MSVALRLWSLERSVQLAITATILLFVLASGSIQSWIPLARRTRWAVLLVLAALALAWAWRRGGPRVLAAAFAAAAAFVALAALSVGWSAAPGDTVATAVAFATVLVAAGALSWASYGRPERVELVLDAVVAGAALVALGGLLVLLLRHDRGVQAATISSPARYQGLGGGPNTATMLFAVALPSAAHLALDGGSTIRRAVGWGVTLGLLASVVASGSRGALVAGFAGLAAWAALREPVARRALAAAAAVGALFVVCALLASVPDADPRASAAEVAADPNPPPVDAVPPYVDANTRLRLQDDVGRSSAPGAEDPGRTLTSSSGRIEAWEGALRQAAGRPLLGYGFGTEERVFVDRFVGFNSGVPENSYVGLALELGAIGIVAFLGLVAALVLPSLRARSVDRRARSLTAACTGALVAGLVLGAFQSYLYAPGNNATAALWICAFLLIALRARPEDARER